MSTIEDKRELKAQPLGYVVCTDSVLSGHGEAESGRSLYALAYHTSNEEEALLISSRLRSDMKRPRTVEKLKADGTPKINLSNSDHLTVVDRGKAERWYWGAAADW